MDSVANYGLVLIVAFVVSYAGIMILRRFWRFDRGVDAGDGVRKHQKEPIIRVGGLPIYAAFVVSFFIAASVESEQSGVLGSFAFLFLGSLIFLLGFLDDLCDVPAQLKFLCQIGIAITAYCCGMKIDIITNPLQEGSIELGGFGLLLTIFWFVAIPNLINLIDGMDGLAGGISLFMAVTLAAIGMVSGNIGLTTLSIGVAGGIGAFLIFNLPPAKIYMGDGGAYLLGFFIAGASLLTSNKSSIFGPLLVVIIALGFPILDTALALVRRSLMGLPVMAPDSRHLHHRMQALGFSKRAILLVLYGIFAGLCLLGLSVFLTKGNTLPIAGMVVVVVFLSALRFLGLPHSLSEAKAVLADVIATREIVRYAYSMAQVLEHDVDHLATDREYWTEVRICLKKLGITPAAKGEDGIYKKCQDGCMVVFPIGTEKLWYLCCPQPRRRREQWHRAIRCFLPALMSGEHRWGGFPKDFGLEPKDESINTDLIEEELNLSGGNCRA